MSHRVLVSVSAVAVVVAVVSLSAIPVAAQTAPRTAWGQPDLQGIWDFRTITPLQRPEELGDKEFLTEEEAANLEQEAVDRDIRLLNRAAERTTAGGNVDRREDGSPGFYNNFWLDQGTSTVGTPSTDIPFLDSSTATASALSVPCHGSAPIDCRHCHRCGPNGIQCER